FTSPSVRMRTSSTGRPVRSSIRRATVPLWVIASSEPRVPSRMGGPESGRFGFGSEEGAVEVTVPVSPLNAPRPTNKREPRRISHPGSGGPTRSTNCRPQGGGEEGEGRGEGSRGRGSVLGVVEVGAGGSGDGLRGGDHRCL